MFSKTYEVNIEPYLYAKTSQIHKNVIQERYVFLKHKNIVNYLNARHPAWEVGRCVSVGDVGDQLETQLTSVKDPLQGAIFFPDC